MANGTDEPGLVTVITTLVLGVLAAPVVFALSAKAWARGRAARREEPLKTRLWASIVKRKREDWS